MHTRSASCHRHLRAAPTTPTSRLPRAPPPPRGSSPVPQPNPPGPAAPAIKPPSSSSSSSSKGIMGDEAQLLLRLSHELLQSIADRDWAKYEELCDADMTAFEPEAAGHLVQGLPFHKFYFDLLAARVPYTPPNNTISQPHVRLLGEDAAVVSYIRLQQKIDSSTGRPVTLATEETRVWAKKGGKWRNVHFHRSPAPS